MATQWRPITMRHQNILVIQRWHGSYWWSSHERPMYSNTWSIITKGIKKLHIRHMGIGKTKLIACKSLYWIAMHSVIENHIKSCSTCLHLQQTQPWEKITHHGIPGKPWQVREADMFKLNSKNYLCIVDYHSKFPIVKRAEDVSAESLIIAYKVIFFRIWIAGG